MFIKYTLAILVVFYTINQAFAAPPKIPNETSSYQELALNIDTSQITEDFTTLIADVDGDSIDDIVLVTASQHSYLYLGDADGGFTLDSTHLAHADIFNNVDYRIESLLAGKIHLVYSTPSSATNAGVFVIDLTANIAADNDLFAAPVQLEHAYANSALQLADMNNDGLTDIVTIVSGTVIVMHINQSDGTFIFPGSDQSKYSTPSASPIRVNNGLFVDANNDGFVDIYGFEPMGTSIYRLDNDADTTHGFVPNLSGRAIEVPVVEIFDGIASGSFALKLADLNNDGLPDVIGTYSLFRDGARNGYIKVYLSSAGTYVEKEFLISAVNSLPSMFIRDIDNDGDIDIVYAGQSSADTTHNVVGYINNTGDHSSTDTSLVMQAPFSTALTEYNYTLDFINSAANELDTVIYGQNRLKTLGDGYVIDIQQQENTTVVATLALTDADDDTIVYSLLNDDGTFTIDAATGALAFATAPEYSFSNTPTNNNTVTVVATANNESTYVIYDIDVVEPAPPGPVFLSGTDTYYGESIGISRLSSGRDIINPDTNRDLNESYTTYVNDFNDDGNQDVLQVFYGTDDNGSIDQIETYFYAGNGDSTFADAIDVGTFLYAGDYQLAKVTGDTLQIVYSANQNNGYSSKNELYIADIADNLNNGRDILSGATLISDESSNIASIKLIDLDGDTDLDIATVGASNTGELVIYKQQSDGTFSSFADGLLATHSSGLGDGSGHNNLSRAGHMHIEDHNNDGLLDIYVASQSQLNVYLADANETDGFDNGTNLSQVTNRSADLFFVDVNGDSHFDVVTMSGDSSTGKILHVLVNDGTNAFTEQTLSLTDYSELNIQFVDLDGDTDLDILATNRSSSSNFGISSIINTGDDTNLASLFVVQPDYITSSHIPNGIFYTDFDNDGINEIIYKKSFRSPLPETEVGSFTSYTNDLVLARLIEIKTFEIDLIEGEQVNRTIGATDLDGDAITYEIAYADLDGDKYTIDETTGQLSFNNLPNFWSGAAVDATDETQVMVKATANGESAFLRYDITVTNANRFPELAYQESPVVNYISLPVNSANDMEVDFSNNSQYIIEDIDRDGTPEIIQLDLNRDSVALIENSATTGFGDISTSSTVPTSGNMVYSVGTNLSGEQLDMVAAYAQSGNANAALNGLYLINIEANYAASSGDLFAGATLITSSLDNVRAIKLADVNGDTFTDIIASSSNTNGQLGVYLNNGLGEFTETLVLDTSSTSDPLAGANVIHLHDYDADNDIDILLHSNGVVRLFKNDGSGIFTSDSDVITGLDDNGSVIDFTFTDFNNDEKVDFMVTINNSSNSVSERNVELYIASDSGFETTELDMSAYNAVSVYAFDHNNDGFADIVYSYSKMIDGELEYGVARRLSIRNFSDLDSTFLASEVLFTETQGVSELQFKSILTTSIPQIIYKPVTSTNLQYVIKTNLVTISHTEENSNTYLGNLSVQDADGDTVDIDLLNIGLDDSAFGDFSNESITLAGQLDYEIPTDVNEDNIYETIVTLTAAGDTSYVHIKVTITDTEEQVSGGNSGGGNGGGVYNEPPRFDTAALGIQRDGFTANSQVLIEQSDLITDFVQVSGNSSDYNNDGKPDVLLQQYDSMTSRLLLSYIAEATDGFTDVTIIDYTPDAGERFLFNDILEGDFDNDGDIDLLVYGGITGSDNNSSQRLIFITNNGSGNYTNTIKDFTFSDENMLFDIAMVALGDDDLLDDLIYLTPQFDDTNGSVSGTEAIYLTHTGNFEFTRTSIVMPSRAPTGSTNNSTTLLGVVDLDDDGQSEIIISEFDTINVYNFDPVTQTHDANLIHTYETIRPNFSHSDVIDINGDGYQDIFVSVSQQGQEYSESRFLLINSGDGTFEKVDISAGGSQMLYSALVSYQDEYFIFIAEMGPNGQPIEGLYTYESGEFELVISPFRGSPNGLGDRNNNGIMDAVYYDYESRSVKFGDYALAEPNVVAEGTSLVFNIAVSDAEGDAISLTLSGDDSALFEIDSDNNLNFISPPSASTALDSNADGLYKVTINANNQSRVDVVVAVQTAADLAAGVSALPPSDSPLLGGDTTDSDDSSETPPVIIDVLATLTPNTSNYDMSLVSASSPFGEVTIVDGKLVFVAPTDFSGMVAITYSVDNGAGAITTYNVNVETNTLNETVAPVIDVASTITINALGLQTPLDLTGVSALDINGETVAVSTLNNIERLPPGRHVIYRQATDSNGNSATVSQTINVMPLVSFGTNKNIKEGNDASIDVYLNGAAPAYPFEVNFLVAGTATGDDHDLIAGSLEIESGLHGVINFTTLVDSISDTDETIVMTFADTVNALADEMLTLTITESEVMPVLNVSVTQDGEPRQIIESSQATLIVNTELTGSDPSQTYTVSIVNSEDVVVEDQDDLSGQITLNVADLVAGNNDLMVVVTDSQNNSVSQPLDLFLVENLPELSSSTDSDGDGIVDSIEGIIDTDGDRIPDYLDNIIASNVLPTTSAINDEYLIEVDAGLLIRLGQISFINGQAQSLLLNSTLPNDDNYTNTGGLFEFEVVNIPVPGQVVNVVIPQQQPIPAEPVYRKYFSEFDAWRDFTVNTNNVIYSAPGITVNTNNGTPGLCPSPKSDLWVVGMIEGYWCVKLAIEDGGENDKDALANGSIIDPGGVSVPTSAGEILILPTLTPSIVFNDGVNPNELTINVLSELTNSTSGVLTLENAFSAYGDVIYESTGEINFTPLVGLSGEARINYVVSNGSGVNTLGYIDLTIHNSNPPTVMNDVISTNHLTAITVDVLANDTDLDGDTLILRSASTETGSVEVVDNQLRYTPAAQNIGVYEVTYVVADSGGATSEGLLSVTVTRKGGGSLNAYWLFILGALLMVRKKQHILALALIAMIGQAQANNVVLTDNWLINAGVNLNKHSTSSQDLRDTIVGSELELSKYSDSSSSC